MIRLAVAATLLAAAPCSGRTTTPTPTPTPDADEVVGKPDADDPPTDVPPPKRPPHTGPCGSAGLTLPDYDFIPAEARLAVAIHLADPDATAALSRLAEYGRSEDHELPITFAFAVTQWPMLVPVLGSMLDGLGMAPAEIVFVTPAKGPPFAWVWHSDCDLDEAIARVESKWGLQARRRVEGVVATTPPDPAAGDGTLADPPKGPAKDGEEPAPSEGGDDRFPYDVVFASGNRMALVPRGQGDAMLRLLPAPGQAGTPAWTEQMSAVTAGPIRGVLTGRSLMGPKAKRTPPLSGLTVTADALTLDAIVAGP